MYLRRFRILLTFFAFILFISLSITIFLFLRLTITINPLTFFWSKKFFVKERKSFEEDFKICNVMLYYMLY